MTSLWPRLPVRARERRGVSPRTPRTKVQHVLLHPACQAPQQPGPAPHKPLPCRARHLLAAAVAMGAGGDLAPDRKVMD